MTPAEEAQIRKRIATDVLLEASAMYWERRASDFDAVVAGDCTPGTDGPEAGVMITERARATAQACRHHAAVLRMEVGKWVDL